MVLAHTLAFSHDMAKVYYLPLLHMGKYFSLFEGYPQYQICQCKSMHLDGGRHMEG